MVTFSDANTHLLMSSRFLNPELDRTDDVAPDAELEALQVDLASGQVNLRITASDASGLRAFALVDTNAGSILGGGQLKGEHVEQDVTVRPLAAKGMLDITLIVTDNGGNQTRVKRKLPLTR